MRPAYVNLIVWNKRLPSRSAPALLESRLLEVQGKIAGGEGDVQHVIAQRLTNLSAMLGDLTVDVAEFSLSSSVSGSFAKRNEI